MNLTCSQFEVLAFLEQKYGGKTMTQRNIAHETGLSIGTVSKTLLQLGKKGYIENNRLIQAAYRRLNHTGLKEPSLSPLGSACA